MLVLERLIAFIVLLMLLFGVSTYTRGDAFGLPWGLDDDEASAPCVDCDRSAFSAAVGEKPGHGRDTRGHDGDGGKDEDRERADDKDHGDGKRGGGEHGKKSGGRGRR